MTGAQKNGLLIGAGAVALLLFFSGSASGAAAGDLHLNDFQGDYPPDNVNALTNLYRSLLNASDPASGEPLTPFQIQILLAQALHESGLFRPEVTNWTMINGNNFTGINAHGQFSANTNGLYARYPNIDTFVNDWLWILLKDTEPLNAGSVTDFVNRLKANRYFEAPASGYLKDVQYYFNLLGGTATT